MKRLTTLLIITLVFGVSSISHAQEFSFGVQAGFNLSTMLAKDDAAKSTDYKLAPGFNIGGVAEMPITDLFSVQAKLLFTTKGFNYKSSGSSTKVNCFLFYTEIPILAKANFEIGNIGVYGLLGPYFGFGLAGRAKVGDDTESIKWGSDGNADDFKRFDAGLSIGAGANLSIVQVGMNYNFGLTNISAYTDDGYRNKNRSFNIFVIYVFGQ